MELYEKIHPEGWKNYPDTTTPIEGDNLTHIEEGIYENSVNIKKVNNVTKYLTATAGANGDFWIDIENDLVAGMVLYISFPTATNPASNARLSIDGGVTYINVRMGSVNVIAEELQNRRLEMVYDGTYFGFVGSIRGGAADENGEWIKYADGTMICSGYAIVTDPITITAGALFRTESQYWEFPKAFITLPAVNLTAQSAINFAYLNGAPTVNGFNFYCLTTSSISSSASRRVYYIAIGKWK